MPLHILRTECRTRHFYLLRMQAGRSPVRVRCDSSTRGGRERAGSLPFLSRPIRSGTMLSSRAVPCPSRLMEHTLPDYTIRTSHGGGGGGGGGGGSGAPSPLGLPLRRPHFSPAPLLRASQHGNYPMPSSLACPSATSSGEWGENMNAKVRVSE